MISVEGPETAPEPHQEPEQAPDPINLGPILVVGALIVIVVAVGAIGATLVRAVFAEEPAPTTTDPRATTTSIAGSIAPPGGFVVDSPILDGVARYEQDGAVILMLLRGEVCGRGEGTIGASGAITNAWMRGTYDYVITVELIRAWNRAVIGELETTVSALQPGATASWDVEMVSSRVSTIDCRITRVVATPVGS